MNKYTALIGFTRCPGTLEFVIRAEYWHQARDLAETLAKKLKGYLVDMEYWNENSNA